jgi:Tol biopolymer transport system component
MSLKLIKLVPLVAAMVFAVACTSAEPAGPDTSGIPGVSVPLKNKIVFMSSTAQGKSNLFIMDVDGSHVIPLTSDTVYYNCPAVSPDGMRVSFLRMGSLYVTKLNGMEPQLLVPSQNVGGGFYLCPVWSPQGDQLALITVVQQVKAPSPSSLYSVNVETGAKRLVLSGYNYSGVEWSYDGTKLLLGSNSYTDGGPYDFRISVLNLDGSKVSQVVSNYWGETWSPDGTQFAYLCGPRWLQVCVANVDGSNVRMLTSPDTSAFAPKWSPDGKRIAYYTSRSIYVTNPDGSGKTQIVAPDQGSVDMAWSPDSKMLAFSCYGQLRVDELTTSVDICTVNADGSGFRRLMVLPAVSGSPGWSPL